jgi:formylglycine-generating enzyme required for sulfatase activity
MIALAGLLYTVITGREPPPPLRDRSLDMRFAATHIAAGDYPDALLAAIDDALELGDGKEPVDAAAWLARFITLSAGLRGEATVARPAPELPATGTARVPESASASLTPPKAPPATDTGAGDRGGSGSRPRKRSALLLPLVTLGLLGIGGSLVALLLSQPPTEPPAVLDGRPAEPGPASAELQLPSAATPEDTPPISAGDIQADAVEPDVTEPDVAVSDVAVSDVAVPDVAVSDVVETQVVESQVAEAQVPEPQVPEPQVPEPQVSDLQVSEPPAAEPPVATPDLVEAPIAEASTAEAPVADSPVAETPEAEVAEDIEIARSEPSAPLPPPEPPSTVASEPPPTSAQVEPPAPEPEPEPERSRPSALDVAAAADRETLLALLDRGADPATVDARLSALGFVAIVSGTERRYRRPGEAEPWRDCESICPELMLIPTGTVEMTVAIGDSLRTLAFEIPQPLAVGRFEVTRDEFSAFILETGWSAGPGCYARQPTWGLNPALSWKEPGFAQTGDDPAVCISHEDATAYLEWLSARTGAHYRLPTDAEWHYLAGAERWPVSEDGSEQCAIGNGADRTALSENPGWQVAACDDGYAGTAPVGRFAAGPWGLHDLNGNAWEWVETCAPEPRADAPFPPPTCPSGAPRLLRGGSWADAPDLRRIDSRVISAPSIRDQVAGFRVVREP